MVDCGESFFINAFHGIQVKTHIIQVIKYHPKNIINLSKKDTRSLFFGGFVYEIILHSF